MLPAAWAWHTAGWRVACTEPTSRAALLRWTPNPTSRDMTLNKSDEVIPFSPKQGTGARRRGLFRSLMRTQPLPSVVRLDRLFINEKVIGKQTWTSVLRVILDELVLQPEPQPPVHRHARFHGLDEDVETQLLGLPHAAADESGGDAPPLMGPVDSEVIER